MASDTKRFLVYNPSTPTRQNHAWMPIKGETVIVDALSAEHAAELLGGKLEQESVVVFGEELFSLNEEDLNTLVFQRGGLILKRTKNSVVESRLWIVELPLIDELVYG